MGSARKFQQNPGNNAICYYRYSSDAQRDVSIDQQQQAAASYADAHGMHIIKEYADRAISGTRDDRAQYNLMLYEIEHIRPAYLILWKTDRLSRDRIDAVRAKARLRECGVHICYVAETVPDDDEATQILLESIYEGLAASFIASHRANILRGMNYNAERALRALHDDDVGIADYWLSGILYCGVCGAPMQGISGTSKSGRTHHYYSCSQHRRHKCTARNKRKDDVETVVSYILRTIACDPSNRAVVALKCHEWYLSQRDNKCAYGASVASQLRDTQSRIDNIMRAIESGIVTETTKSRLEELESTKTRLTDALIAEQNRQKYDLQLSDIVRWLDMFAFDVTDPAQRDEMLRDFIARVTLYDDRVVVLLRYTGVEKSYLFADTLDMIHNQQTIMDILNHANDESVFRLTGCSHTASPGLPAQCYTITGTVFGGVVGIMASLP